MRWVKTDGMLARLYTIIFIYIYIICIYIYIFFEYTLYMYTHLKHDIGSLCIFRFQKLFVFSPQTFGKDIYFHFRLLFPDWGVSQTTTYTVPKRRFAQGSHSLQYMGVSKNKGYPKMDGLYWKTLLKWMIWGVPLFLETPIWVVYAIYFLDTAIQIPTFLVHSRVPQPCYTTSCPPLLVRNNGCGNTCIIIVSDSLQKKHALGVLVSNITYFHPYLRKRTNSRVAYIISFTGGGNKRNIQHLDSFSDTYGIQSPEKKGYTHAFSGASC